jgi:Ser/Thr protein kinase RdoA (MazF antagonist)
MGVEEVLSNYSFDFSNCVVETISGGLINTTWKVSTKGGAYILQKVNTQVFKEPKKISDNLLHLKRDLPDPKNVLLVSPLPNKNGDLLSAFDDGVYRLYDFIDGSHSISSVKNADQAYEAARQFGLFTAIFVNTDINKLEPTLPHFHNLTLRYEQLLKAQASAGRDRLSQSEEAIDTLRKFIWIAERYEHIKSSPAFKLRVTHHDTKISNVLFDEHGKGICVIDLDTVMPGYFISDVGDMMRTYLSEATEEETNLDKVVIRPDIFPAIADGYLQPMRKHLSQQEISHFVYSGFFLTYMQAMRFVTDYLNDDIYYGAKYEGHNLVRGRNQLRLLEQMSLHQDEMEAYVAQI